MPSVAQHHEADGSFLDFFASEGDFFGEFTLSQFPGEVSLDEFSLDFFSAEVSIGINLDRFFDQSHAFFEVGDSFFAFRESAVNVKSSEVCGSFVGHFFRAFFGQFYFGELKIEAFDPGDGLIVLFESVAGYGSIEVFIEGDFGAGFFDSVESHLVIEVGVALESTGDDLLHFRHAFEFGCDGVSVPEASPSG